MKSLHLNSVIFSDIPFPDLLTRNYGAHVISNQIVNQGYTSCVVDFASSLDWHTFTEIVDRFIGEGTLLVGFSVTWFQYRALNLRRFLDTTDEQQGVIDIDDTPDNTSYRESLSYNFSIGNSKKYVDYIKSKNPNVKVIVGGAKAYEYIDDEWFDHILIGYSENQIVDLVNNIKSNTVTNRILNYDVKAQHGNFNFSNSSVHYHGNDFINKDDVLIIELARGCIFNCTFCSWPLRGQNTKLYQKYKETIKKELMENYRLWGVTKYAIADDTFNDSVEKLKLIKEVVDELPFKPMFWCYARLDLISAHPEMAQLMLDIGIVEVFYGIETWNDETAKLIRKGNRNRKIEGLEIAHSVWGDNVSISAALVVGLPEDTIESFEQFKLWFSERGKYIIDFVGVNPLFLRKPDHNYQYLFLSDIEQNLDRYNYSFDEQGSLLSWVRNDSGDISTREIAEQVAKNLVDTLDKPVKRAHGKIDYTSHIHRIIKQDGLSNTEAVDLYAKNFYFPNLIKSFDKYKRRMTGET